SACVVPMPLSRTVRVRASLSTSISMCRSEVSTSRSLFRSASSRSLSSASNAFETIPAETNPYWSRASGPSIQQLACLRLKLQLLDVCSHDFVRQHNLDYKYPER